MSLSPSSELSMKRALPAIILTTIVQAIAAMATLSVASIAPEVSAALDVSTVHIGYQASLIYGSAMCTAMIAGALVLRYGACRISQWSMLLAGIGSILLMVPHVAGIAVGSLLIGLGYGFTNPSASHLLMRMVPEHRRGLVFSLKQTGVPLGGVMAGFLIPPIAIYFGWQPALGVVMFGTVALIIILQIFRQRWDDDRLPDTPLPRNPLSGLHIIWQSPVLRLLSMGAFCYGILQINLSMYLVAMLVEDIHIDLLTAGAILAAVQIAGVSGRILWGAVADRIKNGMLMLIILGTIMTVVTIVTSQSSPDWPTSVLYGVFILFGMTAIGWNGIYLAEVAKHSPSGQVGAATGGSLSITYTGILMGSPLFVLVYNKMDSYADTFGILAISSLLGVLFAFLAKRQAD